MIHFELTSEECIVDLKFCSFCLMFLRCAGSCLTLQLQVYTTTPNVVWMFFFYIWVTSYSSIYSLKTPPSICCLCFFVNDMLTKFTWGYFRAPFSVPLICSLTNTILYYYGFMMNLEIVLCWV